MGNVVAIQFGDLLTSELKRAEEETKVINSPEFEEYLGGGYLIKYNKSFVEFTSYRGVMEEVVRIQHQEVSDKKAVVMKLLIMIKSAIKTDQAAKAGQL